MTNPKSSKNYEELRYYRLLESIDEYLGEQGADSGAGPFLRDLQKACIDLKFYHQECVDSFTTIHDYFS